MSNSFDCLVIGGGVIGMSVARRLALDGASVAIVEKAECGREASWAGAGILSPCNPHRDDTVFHLHQRALAMYPDFCSSLHLETAIDAEYELVGALDILLTDQAVQIARSDVRAAGSRVTPSGSPILELHSSSRTSELEEVVSPDILGSLECGQTALVRNPRLLAALRTSCEKNGIKIHEHAPAYGIVFDGEQATGVALTDKVLYAKKIILCAGAWTSQLHERLAQLMPVHPVRGQMILMKLERRLFTRMITRGKTYLVPRTDGHVLLGSTEEPEAGFQKRCTPQAFTKLTETAVRIVPVIADAPVVATWAGLRPGTPDDKPYIGHVPGMTGLIAATGHFRAGLTLAPVTAEIVAVLAADREYDLDLGCCAPGRLFDRSV